MCRLTFADILERVDDDVFDHNYYGVPGLHEILTLKCEDYELNFYFRLDELVGANKIQQGHSQFISVLDVVKHLHSLLRQGVP